MTRTKWSTLLTALALSGALVACGDDDAPMTTDAGTDAGGAEIDGGGDDGGTGTEDGGGEVAVPDTYEFDSRFTPGASSVAYSGQVARQVLIHDATAFIDGLTERVDTMGEADWSAARVESDLEYYLENTAAERAEDPHGIATSPATLQETYGELSMTAFLLEKIAGNDTSTDHRDWSTAFVGAPAASRFRGAAVDPSTPTGLVRAIFSTVAANAEDRANGVGRVGPDGEELPVHMTADGLHLAELFEKFLFGALAFSQGADDYLDDDAADPAKGLLSPNTRAGTSPYTELEHAWDEGFGYFGVPRHVSQIPLATLIGAERGFDANGDSRIDLTSEYLFPSARYGAQRDSASAESARTAFVAEADLAFRTGRTIIVNAGDTLTADELDALREQRDIVVGAWERALAATMVRYLNGVIRSMLAIGTETYAFSSHAGQWSEMKGLALAFQFNPRSPMLVEEDGVERFERLHMLIGDAPVLATATPEVRTAYLDALRTARALVGAAYGFDAANLGADDGTGGW